MQLIMKSVIFLMLIGLEVYSYELNALRFKNIKCDFNAEYAIDVECKITINKDRQTVITGGLQLIKGIPSMKNQIQVFKWANGYKPAFLKTTIDICQYFTGGGGVVSKLVRQFSAQFMTRNYSCPFVPDWYNTSFSLADLRAVQSMVPFGNYLCSMTFYDGSLTLKYAKIEIFVDIYEKFKPSTKLTKL